MNTEIHTPEYASTDFRQHPERYRIGRGEERILTVEPYKSELLPLWRFRTPEIALDSSRAILLRFERYRLEGDFVGMDMARKFLQMGWTRARRYANHRSGRKYDGPVPPEQRGRSGAHGRSIAPLEPDPIKAESARIFHDAYLLVLSDPDYARLRGDHMERHEPRATKG